MDKHPEEGMDLSTLSELPFFRGESPQNLQWLLGVATTRRLKAGEALIQAHAHNDFLYIVISGLFRVELVGETGQHLVTHIAPGETIGELSVLDGKPTAAKVIADEPARVLAIQRIDLWELIARSHTVTRNLLVLMVQRIRWDDEVLHDSLALQREYAKTARMDSLTGLYNRHWLDEMLPRLIERAHNDGQPLGLLMLDVDHFKDYNDNFGHQAGDEALRAVGAIMLRHIRADDSAARYGGEEFVIILPNLDGHSVGDVAERLCRSIRMESQLMFARQNLPGVRISIGLAMLRPGQHAEELLAAADRALYQAKADGRDRVVAQPED
ncbi:MAG: GGDEF domain-containing protein [Thiohalomonadaceae bacterium]